MGGVKIMVKKSWVTIIIVVIVLVGISFGLQRMLETGNLKVGFPAKDFISLSNGTYRLNELDLPPDTYAIYASRGSGVVTIGGETYDLSSDTFEGIKMNEEGAPESVLYGMLYQESPKVTITDSTVIVVEGDDDFAISFIRH